MAQGTRTRWLSLDNGFLFAGSFTAGIITGSILPVTHADPVPVRTTVQQPEILTAPTAPAEKCHFIIDLCTGEVTIQ